MELWIRSQNREYLIKCNIIAIDEIMNTYRIQSYDSNDDYAINLGHYKTKERALEILDEIQNILNPKIIWHEPITSTKYDENPFETLTTNVIIQTTQKMEYDLKQAGQVVYEMPEE